MLITDQVATAPCTDPIQVQFPTFESKPSRILKVFPQRRKDSPKRVVS